MYWLDWVGVKRKRCSRADDWSGRLSVRVAGEYREFLDPQGLPGACQVRARCLPGACQLAPDEQTRFQARDCESATDMTGDSRRCGATIILLASSLTTGWGTGGQAGRVHD